MQSKLSESSAAQRSAVRCRAVLCCAVVCCVFWRTFSTRYHMKYQVPRADMYVCTRFVAFLIDCPLSVLFMPPTLANYTRIADQNATLPASAQHSTEQSALHK